VAICLFLSTYFEPLRRRRSRRGEGGAPPTAASDCKNKQP
jgi:hypothetical protein